MHIIRFSVNPLFTEDQQKLLPIFFQLKRYLNQMTNIYY